MANTASARKRIRQTEKRTMRNRARRSRVRTFLRKFEEAVTSGDATVKSASSILTAVSGSASTVRPMPHTKEAALAGNREGEMHGLGLQGGVAGPPGKWA